MRQHPWVLGSRCARPRMTTKATKPVILGRSEAETREPRVVIGRRLWVLGSRRARPRMTPLSSARSNRFTRWGAAALAVAAAFAFASASVSRAGPAVVFDPLTG